MTTLSEVRPRSRQAWRHWLQKHHATSTGVWVVYAKKHTGLPSLAYDAAVEEALCFGWIDSKVGPIDHVFYRQVFTPRKPTSVWSALNRSRVERLVASGQMTAAGLAVVEAAKQSGQWDALKPAESLVVPPDLAKAIHGNPEARRNWASCSPSRKKACLYKLLGAKRPETRSRYILQIVEGLVSPLSRAEQMEKAGFRPKASKAGVTSRRSSPTRASR